MRPALETAYALPPRPAAGPISMLKPIAPITMATAPAATAANRQRQNAARCARCGGAVCVAAHRSQRRISDPCKQLLLGQQIRFALCEIRACCEPRQACRCVPCWTRSLSPLYPPGAPVVASVLPLRGKAATAPSPSIPTMSATSAYDISCSSTSINTSRKPGGS